MAKIATPKEIFSVDLRALALLRIMLAILLIYDLVSRLGDLAAFYTDFGVLPRDVFLDKFSNSFHFSVHLAGGKVGWIALIFAIHLVAAAAMLIGYRTRLATVISWLLLISLHVRNPMILNGGDVLFRMAFFWAMFLPLGHRYSVDAALNPDPPAPNKWFGVAGIAIIVQLSLLYLMTAMLKTGKEWWPEGSASYYALALDQFTTPFGIFLSQWHEVLRLSTFLVFALEYSAALLLICPFFFVPMRIATIIALCGMHLQFDLTMRIGLFPWVDMALLLALLPTPVWDFFTMKIATPARKATVLFYDGDCGFCRRMVLILRTFLMLSDAKLETSQSDKEALRILKKEYSWCLKDADGVYHTKYLAVVRLLEVSPVTGWAARRLPLRDFASLGKRAYEAIAKRRDKLGALIARPLPFRALPDPKPSLFTNLVVAFFIGYVILWNITGLDLGIRVTSEWRVVASTFRLDQKWNMFAPYPLKNDGYFVVDGTLENGKKVDVYARIEEEVDWRKPDVVAWQHKNARWRKYMMNIWKKKKKDHRLYWGKYMCRSWNDDRSGKERLHKFTLNFIREKTMPPGEPPELKKYTIWRHNCFKKG